MLDTKLYHLLSFEKSKYRWRIGKKTENITEKQSRISALFDKVQSMLSTEVTFFYNILETVGETE